VNHVLNSRERNGLEKLTEDPIGKDYLIKGQLTGVGHVTLASLVELGLAETGPSKRYYGEMGWRITHDGWRCMYGETVAEMMAKPSDVKRYPFLVWKWPVRSPALSSRTGLGSM
jgi:hypothetical protein